MCYYANVTQPERPGLHNLATYTNGRTTDLLCRQDGINNRTAETKISLASVLSTE